MAGSTAAPFACRPQSPSAWSGLIIHAMAWGEAGAFGDPADINQFEPADATSCDPVPDQNLVGIDFNAGVTNYLQVMNDLDQTVTYTASAGPAGDLRKAVIPNGPYLNFGILSNRLGRPCNPNVAMKMCVDFYDDPALAGALFGPESYAADQYGGSCAPNVAVPKHRALYAARHGEVDPQVVDPSRRQSLRGEYGALDRRAAVRLSLNGHVAVSRFELAALRTTGPLACQDPLADCRPDPVVCTDAYGIYAELDLQRRRHERTGTLGTMAVIRPTSFETAGPPDDRRTSVRNADGNLTVLELQTRRRPDGTGFTGELPLGDRRNLRR